jgi:hypothetical protein
MIEKRFEQIKTVHEIAPVLLKNEGRIEALFTLYFLALLVQAIIERELRLGVLVSRPFDVKAPLADLAIAGVGSAGLAAPACRCGPRAGCARP